MASFFANVVNSQISEVRLDAKVVRYGSFLNEKWTQCFSILRRAANIKHVGYSVLMFITAVCLLFLMKTVKMP